MAGSTSVDVIVRGKGGHGAMPHNTVDPIVLAALLVLDLQTIVSREINPIDPAVVTVGSIHGGTKHNIIPNEVQLQLTLRAFSDEVRDQLDRGDQAPGEGAWPTPTAPRRRPSTISDGTPPTINTPGLVAKVVPCLAQGAGRGERRGGRADDGRRGLRPVRPGRRADLHVPPRDDPARRMVAAAKAKGEPLPSLHSALYHPDPAPSLETGIRAMTAAVAGLLPPAGVEVPRSRPTSTHRPPDYPIHDRRTRCLSPRS